MLREADIFNPAGTLPDVSKSVVIGGNQSASALAGINSGRDYAEAIKAAAYRPLEKTVEVRRAEVVPEFDADPTAPQFNKAALERRNLARELRQSVGSGRRPGGTYSAPAYAEPPLPGMEDTPVATDGDPGNLLGLPPPTDNPPGLFPEQERPAPLLPPPLPTARPWSPADIFRNIFP